MEKEEDTGKKDNGNGKRAGNGKRDGKSKSKLALDRNVNNNDAREWEEGIAGLESAEATGKCWKLNAVVEASSNEKIVKRHQKERHGHCIP